ncbi:MAG: DUF4912 domain-containing protein, partial [Myxococcota bacterium]|nr:DUF4912 domain-containing protein [Myxococcota bacterium]
VLAHEPDHAAARALLTQLADATYPVPAPRLPPETEAEAEGFSPEDSAPAAFPDDAAAEIPPGADPVDVTVAVNASRPPTRYDVDECIAVRLDRETLYVTWEAREETLAHVRPPGEGTLALRVLVVEPNWDGPRNSTRDIELHATVGDARVRDLPGNAVFRVAIGWLHGGAFVPIAHSPALEAPAGAMSPLTASAIMRWTPQGAQRVSAEDGDAGPIRRALDRAGLQPSLASGLSA